MTTGSQIVVATWNAHIWGRKPGYAQELALTPVVEGAAARGYLSLATPEGEPVEVAPPPAARARAVTPPSATRRPAVGQGAGRVRFASPPPAVSQSAMPESAVQGEAAPVGGAAGAVPGAETAEKPGSTEPGRTGSGRKGSGRSRERRTDPGQ